jgi:hypothetical protein
MAQYLTATHATVTELTRNMKGCGHKLYIDLSVFDDLAVK